MQEINLNNLIRSATFFQHAGIASVFVFMPIIAKTVTDSIFEIGLVIASFSFAQILSELYFGRYSDKKGTRLKFIRIGFVGCAITFGLHYFATDLTLLFLARLAGGIASGIMIPPMIAYAYEANFEKKRAATVISFHALGWLLGIASAGIANDTKLIFLISSAFFIAGLFFTTKMPNTLLKKEISPGTTKGVIVKNKFLFLSLLLRHIGASSVWTIFPIMLMDKLGAELYQVSIVYVANTLTAFILMNMMATKIKISHENKFKIGIGCTVFVFIGLLFISDWYMAIPFMALVGGTWAFLFIGGNFHLMDNNPRSTSTGIFSSTISISTVVGPVFAGVIAHSFGFDSVLFFAIAVILVAFAVSLKIKSEF